MGSAAGSAGYPSWSSGTHQAAVPTRPQAGGWPLPPGIGHYEYNPTVFNTAGMASANNTGHNTSFESKDVEAINGRSSLNPVIVHNISQ